MTRVLFFSDTHLGLDWPSRPRLERRRLGDDLYANAERAVTRALAGDVDLVVHGGDLFHHGDAPLWVAERAYALLRRVAERGVPVVVVPGNHERARLPFPLLARQRNIHVFDGPRTVVSSAAGERVALGGFPYVRSVRRVFRRELARTGLADVRADVKLLCVHHCFEGARVGPQNWVFRDADDVVAAADVPAGVSAVLSGHVHRHQVLTHDLGRRPLPAPVLYAGSVERTSVAERGERKGYLLLDFAGARLVGWQFHELPTRPLVLLKLHAGRELDSTLERALAEAPRDALVVLQVEGTLSAGEQRLLGAEALRERVPESMNVRVSGPRRARAGHSAP